uniref:Immunoglobulin V-set domain-containing protein n=2 Tax=Iconisemion striatum TaxID=60296 RepID=A0A1A7X748_9TELE
MWRPACSHGCMMKAHWWSCLLGLLCMPTEVTLSFWTASQSPSSTAWVSINSSVEIVCTTSLRTPEGLTLHGRFHKKEIAYLYIEEGVIKKLTLDTAFKNRTEITPARVDPGLGFTLKLSLLGLDDTDLYYCQWSYLDKGQLEWNLKSNGTIVIVKESGPPEHCKAPSVDLTFISLIAAVFVASLLIIIGVLVWKCRRFKKSFTPARPPRPPPRPPRPNRHQSVCLHQHHGQQQTPQLYPYLITSPYTYTFRDIQLCSEQEQG